MITQLASWVVGLLDAHPWLPLAALVFLGADVAAYRLLTGSWGGWFR